MVRQAAAGVRIFASGGLRDGIDIAKCIALGASMGGMAGHFLKAAAKSADDAAFAIRLALMQLRVAMFAAGAADLDSLQSLELLQS
jgi:isopentenyl-diphosphate delta-isomerase